MDTLVRKDFSRGWLPSADAVNCPANALLRMDNCVLDEQGVVSTRRGSLTVSTLSGTRVDSLFTTYLGATRYRMAGTNTDLYSNGVSLLTEASSTVPFSFGSAYGQIFAARGTTRKKFDGTTLRNWGIATPGPAPTLAVIAPDSKTFATCNNGEAPGFTANEGTVSDVLGQDGTVNGARKLEMPTTGTNRAAMTLTFAAETDFTTYTGGQTGTDDDLIDFYLFVAEPTLVKTVTVAIDINGSATNPFQEDYFSYVLGNYEEIPQRLPDDDYIDQQTENIPEPMRSQVRAQMRESIQAAQDAQSQIRRNLAVGAAGWNHISIPRGVFKRFGSTNGKGWNTVKAIRVTVECLAPGTTTYFDDIKILGGNNRPLTGTYKYCYRLAQDYGQYTALSAASPVSTVLQTKAQGVTVTFPADAARDQQADEIWLYRMGGYLKSWYRVGVKTGVSGVGAFTFDDVVSDLDAMVINIQLDTSDGLPPASIIGIEGPYYDRLYLLSSDGNVYPSRVLNPESYSVGQVITVCGVDESPRWIVKGPGGLYVGTSKDIYRITGTGAEFPDGSLDLELRALNIGSPPVAQNSRGVARESNLIIYLSSDGWRTFNGVSSTPLRGDTSLLWEGQARHGLDPVGPVTSSTHYSAAIANNRLYTVANSYPTPGNVILVYDFSLEKWYLWTFPQAGIPRVLYAEPDGTLLMGENDATAPPVGTPRVFVLETGVSDLSAYGIPYTIWFKVDDDGKPHNRKDAWDALVRMDTGGANASVAIHKDGSAVASQTLTVNQSGMGVHQESLATSVGVWRQLQVRISGTTPVLYAFRLYDYAINYLTHPPILEHYENKPEQPSRKKRRFHGYNVIIDTLGAAATVTPMLDGVAQTTYTITHSGPLLHHQTLATPLTGYDLWLKITKADGFEFYSFEASVLDEFQELVQYWENQPAKPSHVRKRFGGYTLVINTNNVVVTVTPVLDGVDQATQTVQTTSAIPTFITVNNIIGKDLWVKLTAGTAFYGPQTAEPRIIEELPIQFKGLTPAVNAGYPGHKIITGIDIRVCTLNAARSFTPYFDGVAAAAFSLTTGADEAVTEQIEFAAPIIAEDAALSVDGLVELYEWTPRILAKLPQTTRYWENKPDTPAPRRKRFGGLTVVLNTNGVAVTATPYLDNVAQTPVTINTTAPVTTHITVNNVVGKDLWLKLEAATEFYEPYSVEARVVEELPLQVKGLLASTNLGSILHKRVVGIDLKACTLAAARTFTLYVDGAATANTFALTSGADEPASEQWELTTPVRGEDFSLSVDGLVEMYDWKPKVLEVLPETLRFYDNKPKVRADRRRRFSGYALTLIADAACWVDVTLVLDGTDIQTTSCAVAGLEPLRFHITIDDGYEHVGRDLWIRVVPTAPSTAHFYIYPDAAPTVIEEFPIQYQGLGPSTNFGTANKKELAGVQLKACTVNSACTFTPYFDGVAGTTFSLTTGQNEPVTENIEFAAAQICEDFQLKASVPVEMYELKPIIGHTFPPEVKVWENRPEKPSHVRRRFGGVTVLMNTGGVAVTITPVIDGVDQGALAEIFTTSEPLNCFVEIPNDVGKDCWAKCSAATPFFTPYWAEARVVEELPMATKGLLPATNMEWEGDKEISGIEVKACTLAAAVTFTPYLDNVAQGAGYTFVVTSHADEPDTVEIVWATPVKAQDIALSTSAEAEVYSWRPKVTHKYPKKTRFWENRPAQASHTRRRFGGITVNMDTNGVSVTLTPVLDGVDQVTSAVTTSDPLTNYHINLNVVGKDLWLKVTGASAFYEPTLAEARVVETFPLQTRGLHPKTNMETDAIKVFSGMRIKSCTLGAPVTFTPYLDGVASAVTLAITSHADEPATDVLNFLAPTSATDIALFASGPQELYEAVPLVMYTLPGPRKLWDTGPVDLGLSMDSTRVWIREIRIRLKSPANVTVTPYFDDVAFPAYTHVIGADANMMTIISVPVGREYKGRQPRIIVTAAGNVEFQPQWVEFYFRPSGSQGRQLKPRRINAQ